MISAVPTRRLTLPSGKTYELSPDAHATYGVKFYQEVRDAARPGGVRYIEARPPRYTELLEALLALDDEANAA